MNMAKRKRGTKNTIISRRNKRKNNVPFINKEIIFDILSRLPTVFLQNKGRYVCKLWADILRDPKFITTHHFLSVFGLLIQYKSKCLQFLEIKNAEFKLTKLKPCFLGRMLASCDGVSLFLQLHPQETLYVGNPITMKAVKLPCPSATHKILFMCSGIARIPHTGEFQVICPGIYRYAFCDWFIAKVGSNISWKKISITRQQSMSHVFSDWQPISCGSIVYWIRSDNKRNILAINLCDETTHDVQAPKKTFHGYFRFHFLGMDNQLCCIGLELCPAKLHVWILKDSHRSEWTKLYNIEVDLKFKECFFTPLAWLDNNQILVYSIQMLGNSKTQLVAYNVKTGEGKTIKNVNPYHHTVLGHTNSLVSW